MNDIVKGAAQVADNAAPVDDAAATDNSAPEDVSGSDRFETEFDWKALTDEGVDESPAATEQQSMETIDTSVDEPAPKKVESETSPTDEAATPDQVDDPADAVKPADTSEKAVNKELSDAIAPQDEENPEESEDWRKQYTTTRTTAQTQLAEKYQLSEDEVAGFIAKPEEFLPEFAARVYLDVFEASLAAVKQMLPGEVAQIGNAVESARLNEQEFFSTWPDLNDDEGIAAATRLGQVYRAQNPEASREQFIKEVGVQTHLALKRSIPGFDDKSQEDVPAAPAHVPGGTGTVADSPAASPAESSNQFTQLAATWDDDN